MWGGGQKEVGWTSNAPCLPAEESSSPLLCHFPQGSPNPLHPGPSCLSCFYLALHSLPLASNPISHLAKAPSQLEPWDRATTLSVAEPPVRSASEFPVLWERLLLLAGWAWPGLTLCHREGPPASTVGVEGLLGEEVLSLCDLSSVGLPVKPPVDWALYSEMCSHRPRPGLGCQSLSSDFPHCFF